MKSTLKGFGVIALVAIIGFSMVACDNDSNGGVVQPQGPGSRNEPITLQENNWHDGTITAAGQTMHFVFDVVAGTTYRFWVNDEYDGNFSKTLDVMGTLTLPDGRTLTWDDRWSYPETFTPTESGRVQVELRALWDSGTGTFGIVFSTGISRP